jgi:hypothetical protein
LGIFSPAQSPDPIDDFVLDFLSDDDIQILQFYGFYAILGIIFTHLVCTNAEHFIIFF